MNLEHINFEYLDYKAEDFSYIGKRLKIIRDELILEDAKRREISVRKSVFTQRNLSTYLKITNNSINNIEKGSVTSNTFKLILLYQELGYNPSWIIIKNNEFISKKSISQNVVTEKSVQDEFKELEKSVTEALQNFKNKI